MGIITSSEKMDAVECIIPVSNPLLLHCAPHLQCLLRVAHIEYTCELLEKDRDELALWLFAVAPGIKRVVDGLDHADEKSVQRNRDRERPVAECA